MNIFSATCFRYLLSACFGLAVLTACAYPRPAGHWMTLETRAIYLPPVVIDEKTMDQNYAAVCREAQNEINRQLKRELAAKIKPLALVGGKAAGVNADVATLKVSIRRCDIDIDQSGGAFTYYLSLPVNVSLTQNGRTLLDYSMDTYEQVSIDTPAPDFEFTFDEPVTRTLLLFNGRQLWIPND